MNITTEWLRSVGCVIHYSPLWNEWLAFDVSNRPFAKAGYAWDQWEPLLNAYDKKKPRFRVRAISQRGSE